MYFDGCDFSPAYFDASVCAGTSSGRGGGRRVIVKPPTPSTPLLDDGDELFALF